MERKKNSPLLMSFGQNVRKLRLAQNLSQEELAFNAGITINQIGRIERGEINTTLVTIGALASALDLEIHDLFSF